MKSMQLDRVICLRSHKPSGPPVDSRCDTGAASTPSFDVDIPEDEQGMHSGNIRQDVHGASHDVDTVGGDAAMQAVGVR